MNYKKSWLIVIAITVVLAFAFQGSRGLWEPDEGRYVRCAYEMTISGDWLTPRLNGNPHFSKPPLTYWLIATGLSVFGINEWGARIFHGLAFFLTAVFVGLLGARIWDEKTGLLSCLTYMTMVLPFTAANIVTADMLLTCFETAAVLFFWLSLRVGDNRAGIKILWVMAMWLSLGLAFLTKGLPALLPLTVMIMYTLLTKNKRVFSPALTLSGIVLFAVTALPWYFIMINNHDDLLGYFVNNEIIGRIFTGVHNKHTGFLGALKVYPHTLLLGALPWTCYWLVWGWRSRRILITQRWWQQLQQRPAALFMALWFFIPLLLLTIVNSRLPLYMLPLFVPLALATARKFYKHYPAYAKGIVFMQGRPAVILIILFCFLISTRFTAAAVNIKRDSRSVWNMLNATIKQHIGDDSYDLSVVRLNLDGLAFYSGRMFDHLDIHNDHSSSFAPKKTVQDKTEEITGKDAVHIFILASRNVKIVIPAFEKKGIHYTVENGPFDYSLILCKGNGQKNATVKNSAVSDIRPVHTVIPHKKGNPFK